MYGCTQKKLKVEDIGIHQSWNPVFQATFPSKTQENNDSQPLSHLTILPVRLSRVVGVSSSLQQSTGLQHAQMGFQLFHPKAAKDRDSWDSFKKSTIQYIYGRISRVPVNWCKLFWPNQEMSSLGSESYQIIVFLVEFKHLLYLLQKCFDIGHTSRWKTLKPIF